VAGTISPFSITCQQSLKFDLMRILTILLLLASNIAYSQIITNQVTQQIKDNDLRLLNKNEITFSGNLPKNFRVDYIKEFEGSNNSGIDSTHKIVISTTRSIFTYTFPDRIWPIYIELFPGDDINVSFDQNGKILYSSKTNPLRSAELSFYNKNVLFSEKYDFGLPLVKRPLIQNIQYFDSVELARNEYLKEYASKNKISNHFASLINQQIKEQKNKSLASIFVYSKEPNLKMFLPVIDSLKKFYFNNETPYSVERSDGIYQFCRFLTIKEMNLTETPENSFEMAIKYFTGKNLDAILFRIIRKALIANTSSVQTLLKEFYARCKSPELIEKIRAEEAKNNFALDMSISDGLLLLDNTKSTWTQQLAKHKGKVIYVDFWASWCGPCINELPALEKLKEQYVKKGVVFISISTDDQFTAWKSKVDQLKMDSLYSFLLANNKTSQLIKSLDIKTIPRFLLIDKTGKIVSKDAPRPSEKNINALIEKYL